ncbi:MAG: pseudouridine synthase [Leptospirales bacterium]|jgi:23S rRNA pseudouridine2605 synthase
MPNDMRINRYLANAGYGSRREVEGIVRAGRVQINGQEIRELFVRVGTGDEVLVDGRSTRLPESQSYYLLNKPPGYVVSRRGGREEKTIYDLLPPNLQGLKYAGRLDKDSRGLLMLSSDGEFIHAVSHPSKRIWKYYRVAVDRLPPEQELRDRFVRGVTEGGELLRARALRVIDRESGIVEMTLGEGRKRQIRRMFRALGIQVHDLFRYAIGPFDLEKRGIPEGECAAFDPDELAG